jgi:hypothetical protein
VSGAGGVFAAGGLTGSSFGVTDFSASDRSDTVLTACLSRRVAGIDSLWDDGGAAGGGVADRCSTGALVSEFRETCSDGGWTLPVVGLSPPVVCAAGDLFSWSLAGGSSFPGAVAARAAAGRFSVPFFALPAETSLSAVCFGFSVCAEFEPDT